MSILDHNQSFQPTITIMVMIMIVIMIFIKNRCFMLKLAEEEINASVVLIFSKIS